MRFFNERKSKYAIRKFAIGVASVLLGCTTLISEHTAIAQSEQTTNNQMTNNPIVTRYIAIEESKLTEIERALIKKDPLTLLKADNTQTLLTVYRPVKQTEILSNTGESWQMWSGISLGLVISALVILIRNRKGRVIGVCFLVSSPLLLSPDVQASLTKISEQLVTTNYGDTLPEWQIDGYEYIGYLNPSDLSADSILHQLIDVNNHQLNSELKQATDSINVIEDYHNNNNNNNFTTEEKEDTSKNKLTTVDVASPTEPKNEQFLDKVLSEVPVVDLPVSPIDEVSSEPPVVDLPVSPIETVSSEPPVVDLPVSPIETVSSEPPVVDLPVSPIETVSSEPPVDLPVSPIDEVSSEPPVVDLPVSPIETVSSEPPVVDLPVSPIETVSSEPPVVDLPVSPIETVSSEPPVVDLPVSPIETVSSEPPVVDLPVSPIDTVSSEPPVVDLPVSPIETVSSEPPVVDLPVSPIETVSSEPPVVDLPVSSVPTVEHVKKIELKHIDSAYLYRLNEANQFVKVLYLNDIPQDTSQYHIKVNLNKQLPVWLAVDTIQYVNNEYVVSAKLSDSATFNDQGNENGAYTIKVAAQQTNQQSNVYTTFESLINAMNTTPTGTFYIGNDLTATELHLNGGRSYVQSAFMGTLKSVEDKVYTIYDLKGSLFDQLINAKISNIAIKDADVNVSGVIGNSVGILANSTTTTTIDNVHIQGQVSGTNDVGGIVGVLDTDSKLSRSSFVGRVNTANSAGGLAGSVTRNSIIEQSMADVNIVASLNGDGRIGGLTSQLNIGSSIIQSYVRGVVANYGVRDAKTGGAIGAVYGIADGTTVDKGRVENVVSDVVVTNGQEFIGNIATVSANEKQILNNQVISDNAENNSYKHTGIQYVERERANANATTYSSKLTTHRTIDNQQQHSYQNVVGYQASKNIAYNNIEKLIPLYDRQTIVKLANTLSDNSPFLTKEIASVQSYADGKLVHSRFNEKTRINQLVVYYTDGTKETFTLSNPTEFHQTGIIDYTISDTNLVYHAPQFIKDNTKLIESIVPLMDAETYRAELFNPLNLMDWDEAGRSRLIGRLYLEDSFNEIKQQTRELLYGLLDNTEIANYTNDTMNRYMTHYLKNNIKSILAGATYVNRWYHFNDVSDHLFRGLNRYNQGADSLALVTKIGYSPIEQLASDKTHAAYAQLIGQAIGTDSLVSFINRLYKDDKQDNQTIDQWFDAVSKAYIYKTDSQSRPNYPTAIFERLSSPDFQSMILPLLSMRDESVFAIFTSNSSVFGAFETYLNGYRPEMSGYEDKMNKIRSDVRYYGASIQRYFDTLYRVLNEKSVNRLINTDLLVYDAFAGNNGWSDEYGRGATSAVKALAGPLHQWQRYSSYASAYALVDAGIEKFYYSGGRLLSQKGMSTLTHEHMHNLDNTVMLNGFGRRPGHGSESFAMGLFQTPETGEDTLGMNWIFETPNPERNNALVHNASPTRFQNRRDFEIYMRRVFDVLYTLDAAEGMAMIQKGSDWVSKKYSQLKSEYESQAKKDKIDSVEWLVSSGIQYINLKTLDQLVDYGVVSATMPRKEYGNDDYIKDNMFDAHFGINENRQGASGGLTFRRVAFELLAEKGFYEGMIPYISSQYVSDAYEETGSAVTDTFIFNKIFGDKYATMKDFRKDMLERRKRNGQYLKNIQAFHGNNPYYQINNFDDIVRGMRTLMDKENMYAVQSFKRSIFTSLLRKTNDFRESIYEVDIPEDIQKP